MKITLPVHHFPPRYSAGAELYTLRLAQWLQAHGHSVEVVAVEAIDHGGVDELQVVSDHHNGVPVQRLSLNLAAAPDPFAASYDNPLLRAWFDRYLLKTAPDLIHLQAGYLIGVAPLKAAIRAGIPSILTLHDYWFLCPRITLQRGDGSLCTAIPSDPAACAWCLKLEQRRYRYLDHLSAGMIGQGVQRVTTGAEIADRRATLLAALDLPDAVIAPSRFLAAQFAPYIARNRLHVARYGIDLAPFAATPPRDAGSDRLRIGYLGQIAPHKGVHLLIDAFHRLHAADQPIELHIYGGLNAQPRYVERLRRLAGDDARIAFHGRFENHRAAAILANLDVTVVPSQWYENSPLTIMEAHAAGAPVVTAALGGMAELVRDGVDGVHFRAADSADLARQLQRLIDDPALLPRLRSGVQTPRSIDNEMDQIGTIYEQVLTRTAITAPETS